MATTDSDTRPSTRLHPACHHHAHPAWRPTLANAEQSAAVFGAGLATAEERAAEERRQQVETTEKRSSLSALAQLASRHLGETCPVCQQSYDRQRTEAHLRVLIEGESDGPDVPGVDVDAAARLLSEAEQLQAQAQAEVRRLERAEQVRSQWLDQAGRWPLS